MYKLHKLTIIAHSSVIMRRCEVGFGRFCSCLVHNKGTGGCVSISLRRKHLWKPAKLTQTITLTVTQFNGLIEILTNSMDYQLFDVDIDNTIKLVSYVLNSECRVSIKKRAGCSFRGFTCSLDEIADLLAKAGQIRKAIGRITVEVSARVRKKKRTVHDPTMVTHLCLYMTALSLAEFERQQKKKDPNRDVTLLAEIVDEKLQAHRRHVKVSALMHLTIAVLGESSLPSVAPTRLKETYRWIKKEKIEFCLNMSQNVYGEMTQFAESKLPSQVRDAIERIFSVIGTGNVNPPLLSAVDGGSDDFHSVPMTMIE